MAGLLRTLDSITKYPSIDTLHVMEKGRLADVLTDSGRAVAAARELAISEKIDGANARIIFCGKGCPGLGADWFIGSRDELVMARGDRVPNPSLGIAEFLGSTAGRIFDDVRDKLLEAATVSMIVVYGELYGGKVTAGSRNYAQDGSLGFRVFDARVWSREEIEQCLKMELPQIASLREHGKLPGSWLSWYDLQVLCKQLGLLMAPFALSVKFPVPESLENCYILLDSIAGQKTDAAIGENTPGRPEGIVIRTFDRRAIAKLRLEDYERTLRKGRFGLH